MWRGFRGRLLLDLQIFDPWTGNPFSMRCFLCFVFEKWNGISVDNASCNNNLGGKHLNHAAREILRGKRNEWREGRGKGPVLVLLLRPRGVHFFSFFLTVSILFFCLAFWALSGVGGEGKKKKKRASLYEAMRVWIWYFSFLATLLFFSAPHFSGSRGKFVFSFANKDLQREKN